MTHGSVRTVLALLSVIGLLLVGSVSSASARAIVSPQHVDQTECYSYDQYDPDGTVHVFTACYRVSGFFQDVETPSGNVLHSFQGTSTSTLFIDGVLYEPSTVVYSANFRTLTKDGLLHLMSQHANYTFTIEGLSCTSVIDLQYANNQIRFNNRSFTCS